MGNLLQDDFNRPDGALGVSANGYPYSILRGLVTVKTRRAYAEPGSPGSIAVLDAGLDGQDGIASAGVGAGGGYALYVRVQDAANWHRLSIKRSEVTTQTGSTQTLTGYQQVQVGTRQVYQGEQTVITGYQSVFTGYQSVFTGYQTVQSGTQQALTGYQNVVVGYNYWTQYGMYLVNPTTNALVQPVYSHLKRVYHYYPQQGYPGIGEFPDEPTDVPGDYGHVYRAQPSTMSQGYDQVTQSQPIYEQQPVYTQQPIYENQPLYEQRAIYGTQSVYTTEPIYENRPVYATTPTYTTSTVYEVKQHRSVGGSIVEIKTAVVTGVPASLKIKVDGNTLEAFDPVTGASMWTVTDPTFATATKQGFGFAETTAVGNSDGLDDFVFSPARGGLYVPAVMR